MPIEQSLLNEYKKYDYLNSDNKNPLVKILVSYIKPSFLYKSEILTPIHLGRAVAKENSKDGIISNEDLNWLYENCIGDDDFKDNISNVNRRVGFLTGTYWAWKNYEKLNNPKYFGSFGYRRLFSPEFLNSLTNYDCIIPKQTTLHTKSIKEQFIIYHGKKHYDIMFEAVKNIYPEELSNLNNYFSQHFSYLCEIYIFKKELFFKFCEWIFPLLFYLLNLDNNKFLYTEEEEDFIINKRLAYFGSSCTKENYKLVFLRAIGFIIERLTGYYIHTLTQNKNIKYCEVPVIYTEEKQENETRNKLIFESLRKNIKGAL